MDEILNFTILGKTNSGKCSLNKAINLYVKNLVNLNDFKYKNINYHLFPIPCCGIEYKENIEFSLFNSDFIIITIPINEDIKNDYNFYFFIILSCLYLDITKIVMTFTKCENLNDNTLSTTYINYINEIYNKIKLTENLNNDLNISFAIVDSLKGEGIENLLNLFPKESENKKNKIFGVYDNYKDTDKNEFVISGKLVNINSEGDNSFEKLKINESKLNFNFSKNSEKKATLLTLKKLCLSDGQYIESININKNHFITLKFDLNSEIDITKNCFINFSENSNLLCFFDTLEADISLNNFSLINTEIKESPFTILTKGIKCLFYNYNTFMECSIINIVGEYNKNNEIIKKKIINNCNQGNKIKIAINLNKPILATKFEICKKFGSFFLIKEDNIFAIGKIIKYKPFK